MTPTQRALKVLRDDGFSPWIVEKWNQFARIRQDLYGIIDIVAIKPTVTGVLGVQCTSMGNGSARKRKALESPYLAPWCLAGNVFEIWEFGKQGARGKKKEWKLKVTRVTHLMTYEESHE
jgi:hypothetical protein